MMGPGTHHSEAVFKSTGDSFTKRKGGLMKRYMLKYLLH